MIVADLPPVILIYNKFPLKSDPCVTTIMFEVLFVCATIYAIALNSGVIL